MVEEMSNIMGDGENEETPGTSTSERTVHHPLEEHANDVKENGRKTADYSSQVSMPIKIPIVGFETMEERAKFTIFKLRVEHETLDESWLVFRRYTDFVRLHSKIKDDVPDIEISIPPKRWLRDNFETAFLEDRMKGLQALIDSIIVQPVLVNLPTVRKFFCLDEAPVYSDTAEETKSWCGIIEDSAVMLRHRLGEKDREVELLRAELALALTQKDNLIKMVRNCKSCCQKQLLLSSSFNLCCSPSHLPPTTLPSSGSSSETGSPRHNKTSVTSHGNTILSTKHRKSSTSSRTSSSTQSDLFRSRCVQEQHLSNGAFENESNSNMTITVSDNQSYMQNSNK